MLAGFDLVNLGSSGAQLFRTLRNAEEDKMQIRFPLVVAMALAISSGQSLAQSNSQETATSTNSECHRESAWTDITATLLGGTKRPSGIVLKTAQRATTRDAYAVPIEIEYVCKTDSTNLRLAYACDQLIFDWELDPDQLRIDGGPVGGQHRGGVGRITPNRFTTIRQVVYKNKMEVFVANKLRASWAGDFSNIESPISIFSPYDVKGVTLTVKSLRVRKLQNKEIGLTSGH